MIISIIPLKNLSLEVSNKTGYTPSRLNKEGCL
jgi:hypothetical protein